MLLLWFLLETTMVQDSASTTLLREADGLRGSRKWAEAIDRYRRCSEEAAKEGNRAVQVEALAQMARCYSVEGKLDEGRPWLERAEKLGSADDPAAWACLLRTRGVYQRDSGEKS